MAARTAKTTNEWEIKMNRTINAIKDGEQVATEELFDIVNSMEITSLMLATVYKGNIIKNLIMDCQSYTKYRPNETTGGIFVSWRRKEELPTGA